PSSTCAWCGLSFGYSWKSSSERLQVLHNGVFVGRVLEIRTVCVALVAIARNDVAVLVVSSVEIEAASVLPSNIANEPDLHGIKNVVSTIELGRPQCRRLEQIAQCRHGSIV